MYFVHFIVMKNKTHNYKQEWTLMDTRLSGESHWPLALLCTLWYKVNETQLDFVKKKNV